MLKDISWSNYTIAVFVLMVLWYGFLIFHFYHPLLTAVLSGKKKFTVPLMNGKVIKKRMDGRQNENPFGEYPESFSTMEDALELSDKIINAVKESADKELSRQEFKNYMQLILNEYPYVRISSLREKINMLIISECEKQQQIILTDTEVNALWHEMM